ncbi:hypothetical protein [Tenacibaculum xiamenense]|uniref:hypothetical protein n=1 Tax=Tenacibaculum xiamenense TaxID=1261553 RepID=UPI0038964C24
MKLNYTLFCCLFSLFIFGQEIKTTNFINEIRNYDISNVLTKERPAPMGFIGGNYQRFYIHFVSVIKNSNNPLEYFVYGKSKVKNNICPFQGKITIKKCGTYIDPDFPDAKQGTIVGEYRFFEDPNQRGSGTFKGNFSSDFMFDKKGQLAYNDIMFGADGFTNNEFEGTWVSYKTKSSKTCNWGDYRIPNSGDLDLGAGEFSPNPKYIANGWKNYQLAWSFNSDKASEEKARQKEKEKWWLKE